MKLFRCNNCNRLIVEITDESSKINCCKENLELIDLAKVNQSEEHKPHYRHVGNLLNVKIGKNSHPMIDIHYIKYIIVQTTNGIQIERLKPNTNSNTNILLKDNEEVIGVYSYCSVP